MRQPIDRRAFLMASIAAASGHGEAAAKRVAKMRFGFTTYQWGKDWDVPTLIANCQTAEAFGVELRTSQNYAHGVELELTPPQRREVKLRFVDSPVMLVGLACGERFDSPDAGKLRESIEKAQAYARLSHDVGGTGLRVFPNSFHEGVPREETIGQIARSLTVVGKFAADYGQMIRLENHGTAGRLTTLRKIMDQVEASNVRVKLNSDARDTAGAGFEHNFNLVKDRLADTLHLHDLEDPEFPYQLQTDLLIDLGWDGWCLVEQSAKVPDRLAALIEQRRLWEKLVARSLERG